MGNYLKRLETELPVRSWLKRFETAGNALKQPGSKKARQKQVEEHKEVEHRVVFGLVSSLVRATNPVGGFLIDVQQRSTATFDPGFLADLFENR